MAIDLEWIEIPAGKVDIEGHGTFEVESFAISKYPITVAQYRIFMDDGGYDAAEFWTEPGWSWRQKENITLPCYWYEKDYKYLFKPDHPIIGVSWYEALAFCRWLSQKTDVNILLPTEQEWQRAAQGDDGRIYPWGNEWDAKRCNSRQSGIDATTSVTQYPNGASPYGVMDMSGNVYEWTLSEYGTALNNDIFNIKPRVLRGGSWFEDNQYLFCTGSRELDDPNSRDFNIGLRCVRFFE